MTSMTTTGRRVVAVILCAILSFIAQPATATAAATTGALRLVREAEAGFDPKVDTAVFQARRLEGFPATDNSTLGQLSVDNPRLLTAKPGYELGPVVEARTNRDGVAVFESLASGVYQISEKSTHSGNEYHPAAMPFLVHVEAGQSVQAKTKPGTVAVIKEVFPRAVAPGGAVRYHVAATVVPVDASGALHQFVVADELDPRLSFEEINGVVISTVDGTIALAAGTHYITFVHEQVVGIVLTGAGLRMLADARSGNPETRVELDIHARVRAGADASTPIRNIAGYAPDGHALPWERALLGYFMNSLGATLGADGILTMPGGEQLLTEASAGFPATLSEAVDLQVVPRPPGGGSSSDTGWGWVALLALLGLGGGIAGSSSGTPGDGADGAVPEGESPTARAPGTEDGPGNTGGSGDKQAPTGPGAASPRTALATTGANVLGVAALGIILILVGVMLVRRRGAARSDKEHSEAGGDGRG